MKTNLNLKAGIAFDRDLTTYRSINPSSSSLLSHKQDLKSSPTVLSSIPTPVICTTSSAKHNREIMIKHQTFQCQDNDKDVSSQAYTFKEDLESGMLTDVTINQFEALEKEERASRRSLLEKVKHQDIFFKLQPHPKVATLANPFSDGVYLDEGSKSRWTRKPRRERIYDNPSVKYSPRAYQNTASVVGSHFVKSFVPSSTLTSKDLSNR